MVGPTSSGHNITGIQTYLPVKNKYLQPMPSLLIETGIHIISMHVPYSGKFSKGLIFENFKSSQAFSKIFFRN